MELAFIDQEFRDLCVNESIAKQVLGLPLASSLKKRLADLSAASMVADIFGLPGRPRELTGYNQEKIAVNLIDNHLLLFTSGHLNTPYLPTGTVDWSNVRRIKILGIDNEHE